MSWTLIQLRTVPVQSLRYHIDCFFQYFLPLDLITKEAFTQWMELLRRVVERDVPDVSKPSRYTLVKFSI